MILNELELSKQTKFQGRKISPQKKFCCLQENERTEPAKEWVRKTNKYSSDDIARKKKIILYCYWWSQAAAGRKIVQSTSSVQGKASNTVV